MKTSIYSLLVLSVILLFTFSCKKNSSTSNDYPLAQNTQNNNDEIGLEFYFTSNEINFNQDFNLNDFDFATQQLEADPFITYNDIQYFDANENIFILNKTYQELGNGNISVYGKLFIATIDQEPVFYGFLWPPYSSVRCPSTFLTPSFDVCDNIAGKALKLYFDSNDSDIEGEVENKIIERLFTDNKIKTVCKKEAETTCIENVEGTIIDMGDEASDGCGWMIKVDTTLLKPNSLSDEFLIDQLPVLFDYKPTRIYNHCGFSSITYENIDLCKLSVKE